MGRLSRNAGRRLHRRPVPRARLRRFGGVKRSGGDPLHWSHTLLIAISAVREHLEVDAGITPDCCDDRGKVDQDLGAVLRLIARWFFLNEMNDSSNGGLHDSPFYRLRCG